MPLAPALPPRALCSRLAVVPFRPIAVPASISISTSTSSPLSFASSATPAASFATSAPRASKAPKTSKASRVAQAADVARLPPTLANRTVFVHANPAPTSLTERRHILRALERHAGAVDMFKKLAANDSFVCVAASPSAAHVLVERSPFLYDAKDVHAASASASTGAFGALGAEHAPRFIVSVFPSPSYSHVAAVRSGPLHGPWPVDVEPTLATSPSFKNTFMYNALRAVVPESASADALCDWRPRIVMGARADAHAAGAAQTATEPEDPDDPDGLFAPMDEDT